MNDPYIARSLVRKRRHLRIPHKPQCLQLLENMQMPAHIQAHSMLVCRVAMLLAKGLLSAGVKVNCELVYASALLHDITKPRSFETGENHAQTGGEYLCALGFGEVGDIVRQHVILDAYFAGDTPNEAEVINYADKRVLHDQVVPLDDRMEYILHRYAKTAEHRRRMRQIWDQTLLLEKRLFSYLNFGPGQVADQLSVKDSPD